MAGMICESSRPNLAKDNLWLRVPMDAIPVVLLRISAQEVVLISQSLLEWKQYS
jgi:hypothetical protein